MATPTKSRSVKFVGGRNIAMKVPPHLWEDTVRFYRNVVGLKVLEDSPPSVVFQFGTNQLWIDRVDSLSQAEIWLELCADDVQAASQHFKAARVVRRDEIESLPEGFAGFWIANPASIIHLVSKENTTKGELKI